MSINVGGGELKELKARFLVIGVGCAGGNALNKMNVLIEDIDIPWPTKLKPNHNVK